MNNFSKVLAAAAIALWIGTLGGGIVGYNIGGKLVGEPIVAPSAEVSPETSPSGNPSPSPKAQPLAGEQGPADEVGLTGATGVAGPVGAIGPVGTQGETGPQGEPGPMGPAGPIGPQGLVGEAGATGAVGATGAQGSAGPAGAAGATGATGATGPMGPVGPRGPSGVVLAESPATYDAGTQSIGVDQSAFDYLGSLGYLQFSTSAAATAEIGRLRWNAEDGTLDLSLGGGEVTLQVGQEMVQPVRNSTSETLLNGRAVRISGAYAGRMTVEYADATDPAKTTGVIGILTQDIAPGEVGFVTTTGLVRGIDTSMGSSGSTIYVDGNGILTSTRPTIGAVMVIGHIVFSDAVNGSVFVDTATTFTPGAGLPCTGGPNNSLGIYKWETAGPGDYYLSCDITP